MAMVSRMNERIVDCPFCGKQFPYPKCQEIHIPGDHKLKKRLLNKALFFPVCPHCGEEVKLKPNCVYWNENTLDLFAVTSKPNEKEFGKVLAKCGMQPERFQAGGDDGNTAGGTSTRRLVYDVESFREKILLSDNNYDDRIMELIKLSITERLEKEEGMPVHGIILEDASGGQMEFTAFMGTEPPFDAVVVHTPAFSYTQFDDIYRGMLGRPQDDAFLFTDQEWARKSGLLERG